MYAHAYDAMALFLTLVDVALGPSNRTSVWLSLVRHHQARLAQTQAC